MPAPLLLLLTVLLGAQLSARAENLIVLLDAGSCPNCTLADADLVHADLRDANLKQLICDGPISAEPAWMGPISAMQIFASAT